MKRISVKEADKSENEPQADANCNRNKKIPLKQILTVESSLGKITLLALAFPLFAESLATHLLSTVNTAVLGGYSPISVGAIGGATPVINIINLLNLATSTGAIILLGNVFGKGDKKGIKDISRTVTVYNCKQFGLFLLSLRVHVIQLLSF